MNKTAVLKVIDGDYGLISLEPGSIASVLYAKLKCVPVEIEIQNSLKSCAFYNAPCWVCGTLSIEKFPNILAQWNKLHGSLDEELSAREASETLALTNLVTTKLDPVIQFLYWVDQRNSDELFSRWFMKALPFPFNYSYVKRKKTQALELMETLYPCDSDLEVVKEFLTKTATQCLSTLSTRLGKSSFFYGNSPRSLDVVVYAYVAPLVKLPFPSNDIASLLSMWPNLTEFVKRVDTKYLPETKQKVKYLQSEANHKQSDDEVSYMAIFILAVSATSIVVGFAMKRGLLKLPIFK